MNRKANPHLHGNGMARLALAAMAAAAPLAVTAGLRPWEPSDYVQDDLVLHFDGIRNAGADAAHDPDATTWKDLSPSGNDATLKSNGVTTYGTSGWADNGYMFYRNAWFLTDRAQSFEGDDGDFTIQAVVDFSQSAANLVSWPMVFDSSDGTTTIQAYWNNTSGQNKAYLLADKYTGASGGNASGRPYLTSAWAGHYLTAAFATASGGGKDAWLFEGTTYPTAHPGYVKGGSSSTALNAKWAFGSIVSDSGRSDRLFTGKIQSIRAYSHKLSEAELAWNRALDEARFRGAASVPELALCASSIPDAVVATAVTGADGAEASGCYVVDGDGHTFHAAPFATVGAASYACTGCTVAEWDASLGAWGAPVPRDGVFAVPVAPGDKVRIEWQWEAASGSLDAGYVSDSLALRLDGIDNAGIGVHDSSATTWKDLSGNGRDAFLYGNADGTSLWTDNGYYFNFNAVFSTAEKFAFGTQHTFEILMDAKRSDWWVDNNEKDILVPSTGPTGAGGIYYKAANAILCHRSDATTGSAWNAMPGFYQLATVTYLAALRDNAKTALITGTTYPETEYDVANGGLDSQNFVTNAWLVGSKNLVADPTTWLVGGRKTTPANTTKGTVKSVRLYNRLLTEAELARNRAIDEARFFGKIPATGCVVIESAVAGLEGREPSGTYFPDGWTFTAGGATNTVRGIGWVCAGYQLQTWDAASSTWGTQQTVLRDGGNDVEYTSPSGTSFASVRLTWLWKPVSGIRTAADYALADYATGGIQLHLDGLARGDSATVWSDLSGNGRNATLAGNGTGESHWTDDGYFFASNAVFATADTSTGKFSLGHDYTMQAVSDVNFADNLRASNAQGGTFVSPIDHYAYGSIWIKSDGTGTIQHRTGDTTGAAWNMNAAVIVGTEGHATYLTALRNGNRTALLDGTAYPTTSNTIKNQACIDWSEGSKDSAAAATRWGIGASSGGGGANPLYGTVKSVRLYDRMLTEDELAWNRNVDSARYFGALATTNVVVSASDWQGDLAPDAYQVFGTATFTGAPDANFVRVRTIQPDGTWGAAENVEGNSYTYDASAGVVQIEFRKTNPFVLVIR